MRKRTICISENKDADELPGNYEAGECLSFRCSDNTILRLFLSEILSLLLSSVTWLFMSFYLIHN